MDVPGWRGGIQAASRGKTRRLRAEMLSRG
ncbi:hypothetical protein ACSSVY_000445 [Roseovarius sp. MBR-51]